MAGIEFNPGIVDDIELRKLKTALQDLNKKATNAKEPLNIARLLMYKDVIRHFQEEKGPKGDWKPLKKATILRRRKMGVGAKILQDTGRLRMSIVHSADRFSAKVGTNLKYANRHNYGWPPKTATITPARPFMFLNEDTQKDIINRFKLYLKG